MGIRVLDSSIDAKYWWQKLTNHNFVCSENKNEKQKKRKKKREKEKIK